MANNSGNSDKFRASGCEKFDLNLRSHLEICHGKQTHADVAEIDTKTIQLGRLGEYLTEVFSKCRFRRRRSGLKRRLRIICPPVKTR